jgi:hypothetical protein
MVNHQEGITKTVKLQAFFITVVRHKLCSLRL